jgi:hypothetical protein
MSFLLLLMSSLQKIGEKGRIGSAWKRGRVGGQEGEMAQTMYAHLNK